MLITVRIAMGVALLGALATGASGDTIWLNTGIKFDGIVTKRDDGLYNVKAGKRLLVYRPEEVASVEKNDLTGELDLEEVKARWAQQDAELTAKFGLNAEQRRAVEALLGNLQNEDLSVRIPARDELVAMNEKVGIFPYLLYLYPDASHVLTPPLLELMLMINPAEAKPLVVAALSNTYYGIRKQAIELLTRMGDASAADQVARGLADHNYEVRIAAAYALAAFGARKTTPALIELLTHPDLRVSNAAREALNVLWQAETGGQQLVAVDEWKALWEKSGASAGGKIAMADLTPLVAAEEEFQNE